MKILHITNELSKKNFSISSLIIFISHNLLSIYKYKYRILTSKVENNLFKNENIEVFDINHFISFLFKIKKLYNYINNYDIIHVHGVWAPIQLFSIILCNIKKKNCIIHPHGMLLKEALISSGLIKLIFKHFFLLVLKSIISNRTFFVSITNQEIVAIKKFFPYTKIKQIYNPIPFKKNIFKQTGKKKQFVYFGRIHPHKNIDLVIKAFKNAKLTNDWKLKIFGIMDDFNYFNQLKILIGQDHRIEIKEPVFNEEKQAILNESWLNLLLSKSEVLSLSILEASIYSLPSLVNKNLEVTNIEDSVIPSATNIESIKKNLESSSKWTVKERLNRGKDIYKNVTRITSIENISLKYKELYDNLSGYSEVFDSYSKNLFSPKNVRFLLITISYMFNLMFSSFIMIGLVAFGYYSKAAELGLVISFWITLTQIFSSNVRSIILSENKIEYVFPTLIYRIFVSIIFFIFVCIFVLNFISFENLDLVILFSLLILLQWINEMSLVKAEVQKKNSFFKLNSVVIFSLIFSTAVCLLFSPIYYLKYVILMCIIFIIVSIFINFFNFRFKFFSLDLSSILSLNLKTIAFLSSFSIVISSFVWRLIIYYIFEKPIAGIFFACFSIGSFPGTIFNSVIGPAFIKQKIRLSKYVFNTLLLFLGLITIWFSINLNNILITDYKNYLNNDFIFFTISISLIGSYLMCYSMYLRHLLIQISSKTRKNLFHADIIYGISITFIIPALYYLGGELAVSFSFFTASVIALIIYYYEYNSNLYKNIR